MSENCNHNCDSCGVDCPSRQSGGTQAQPDFQKPLHPMSNVGRVIGVMSGKGGVGKSLVCSMLAAMLSRKGYRTAILDGDITGPSIPKMFGITGKAESCEQGLLPVRSKGGVSVMSLNLLLENETDPVIWRGPVIAGAVTQFWTDVIWEDIDVMFVDMPPGTGDVPLTVMQSLPIDAMVMVTSPQELVSMIVHKAVNMVNMMEVPLLGVVENMSYATCPDCGKRINIFGESKLDQVAADYRLPILGRIPIDPAIAQKADRGEIETVEGEWLREAENQLERMISNGK